MKKSIDGISGPDMAEWCALLNDDNEIHLSREAAEAAGFGPHRVNPGPANLAYLMSMIGEDIASVDAIFTGNVFEDDDLVAEVDTPGPEGHEARLSRGDQVLLTARFKERS